MGDSLKNNSGEDQKRAEQQKSADHISYTETVAPTGETVVSLSASQVEAHSVAPMSGSANLEKQYSLEHELGAGGMGAVYRAYDESLHRKVAVKVMHAEVAAREVMVRRFYKEAQIAAQLEHPGIVPTYNIQLTEGGQPRLAMRLIRGQDLDSMIESEFKRLTNGSDELDGAQALAEVDDRLELFVRACDAVQFAHDKGVVHRDLKPENIMVGPHRDAYVMDWGLATLSGEAAEGPVSKEEAVEVSDDPKATRVGELMGTVAYMAPEQAIGDHDSVGPAADQFALGLTLQEVVTLQPARTADTMTAAVTKAIMGETDELPTWTPRGLRAIIDKASAKEIADRYASVAELAEDVRRYLRDEELLAAPDPLSTRIWRSLSKHRSMVLGAALLLVAAVATLSVMQILDELGRERREALHAAMVSRQEALVAERGQVMNARTRGIEYQLAEIAGATKEVLVRPGPRRAKVIRPADLVGKFPPKGTRHEERYNQVVNFDSAVLTRAPDSDDYKAIVDERRLSTVEDTLIAAYKQGGFARTTRSDAPPLQWIYVATPNGVLLNYPGAAGLKSDYDPRTRPWYLAAKESHSPHWGTPYGDASGSGSLLPCNRAIFDDDGDLLAVVGIDLHLRDVRAALPLPQLPGYLDAWLVNAEGKVVAKPPKGEKEATDDKARQLETFEPKSVWNAIQEQPAAGQRVVKGTRYIYTSLSGVGWFYVVAAKAR